MTVEVDQSGRIEDLSTGTAIDFYIKKAGLIDITLRFYGEGSLRIRL